MIELHECPIFFTVIFISDIQNTVKCSFFSWFTDSQHNNDLDEIQDEVNSAQAYYWMGLGFINISSSYNKYIFMCFVPCLL